MDWLVKLKDVVYAAEDVLDEWNTKTALLKHETGDVDSAGSTRKKVLSILLSICLCFKDVSVRYDIGGQIKELGKRLDEIAEEKGKYALVASDSHHDLRPSVPPLTTSLVNVSDIVGRDRDKQIIIDFLLSDSSSQGRVPVQVISVVGTGGFGKTTLARLVFKEKNVKNAFKYKIWVCVSQSFDQVRIAKEIIEQITGNVPTFHGMQRLHKHLSKAVKEKKFLLILDDVWTSDDRDWEPLRLCLSGGASGSRIVVTTRSREVAMMMRSAHIHDLMILSEEDSWSLLSHVALRGREHEHRKFEKIGREIALKCKGVPLAIKTLASVLCNKRDIKEWRDVANNNLWKMPKIKEYFLPSFFISYYSLSPVSKQCFLFCSVFPKDTRMRKRDLVELWMANGFFGYQGNKELEKIGEHHFDTLVMCSFFQDFQREDWSESIKSCQMHDLVHDFAQFLSQGECVIEDGNNGEFDASRVRHLWTRNFSDELYNANNLRTVMGLGSDIVPHIGKLMCLRTLDLSGGDLEELPSAVCKLLHLRFLDLSRNRRISELPEEICSLYNLQTLRLSYCFGVRILPERIGDLCNLRVLDIHGTSINCLPVGFRKLIFLRSLSTFIVGESNAECKIGDLSYLNKLRGSLSIEDLGRIKDANEADQVELKKREYIDDLTLSFTTGPAETSNSVLQRLDPPKDLKRLRIISYPGDRFPGWMYNSSLLKSLVRINLDNCANCTELPPLGKLESLEVLDLIQLRSVKRLGPEFFGGVVSFPKLTKLSIIGMSELEEWNFLQGDVSPYLCKLYISSCPKLTKFPNYMFQPRKTLSFRDCKSLDFDLKDLQQNATLQYLQIHKCPHLRKRFEGKEWRSILLHVPVIILNSRTIKKNMAMLLPKKPEN